MSGHFSQFLAALPPDGPLTPCPAEAIAPYREHAGEGLVRLWTELGWGSFGGGMIHMVDPATLVEELAGFLGSSHPTRIPFARSAFGDLYYYRDMRRDAERKGMTGENPGELHDISYVDVHFKHIDVIAFEVEELLEDVFAIADNIEGPLRGALVRAASEIYGPLAAHECFAFVPALALGGGEDISCVRKVDMRVHLSLLAQM